MNGNGGTGFIASQSPVLLQNYSNVLQSGNTTLGSNLTVQGSTDFVGNAYNQTVFNNFATVGGAGSGGGAGLGGAFFVDSQSTLNLVNTSFTNTTTTGGSGGGVPDDSVLGQAFQVTAATISASPVEQVLPTASGTLVYTGGVAGPGSVYSEYTFTLQVKTITIPQASQLIGVGAGVALPGVITASTTAQNLPKASPYISTVASFQDNPNGSETVTLTKPITLTDADVTAASGGTLGFVSGQAIVLNSGTANASSDSWYLKATSPQYFQVGNSVIGPNIPDGVTISKIYLDGSTNSQVEYFDAVNKDGTPFVFTDGQKFGVLYQLGFDFGRFAVDLSTPYSFTLTTTAPLAGWQPGMVATGSGVIPGTKIVSVTPFVDSTTGYTYYTVTFNLPVNLQTATDLTVGFTPVVSNTSNGAVLDLQSVTGLAVGQTIVGIGIPNGTKITAINGTQITLSNPIGQGGLTQITSSSLILSVDNVTSSTSIDPVDQLGGGTVTLTSVAGFKVGHGLTGDPSIPTNAIITKIDPTTNTITYTLSTLPVGQGGSLNNLAPTPAPGPAYNGLQGTNFGTVDAGEGWQGQNGSNGFSGTNGPGGRGGNGGLGTNGSSTNNSLIVEVVGDSLDTVADVLSIYSSSSLYPPNKGSTNVPAVAAGVLSLVQALQSLIYNSIQLADWNAAEQQGLVAIGGSGGYGGSGGNGTAYFGGGAGGNGGNGGQNGNPGAGIGGAGGSGGEGGSGGFGAGGGAGGAEGSPGQNGASGSNGAAGTAGFGGGAGSVTVVNADGTTSSMNGQGGSGYGGAIFVRNGGTLNIYGNAVFQYNQAYAGASVNGGQAGQFAGNDLFIQTGANVSLKPGAGNTITFWDSIADDSASSISGSAIPAGQGANITIGGGGTVQFNGNNTYSGTTYISGATLEAQDGVGLPAYSHLVFDGAGSIGVGLATDLSFNNSGVLLTGGTFTRPVGLNPVDVAWTDGQVDGNAGSGGFAATAGGLMVNLGSNNGGVGPTLTWNQGGFVPTGSALIFGSDAVDATGSVAFKNPINLNGLAGQIAVYHNFGSTTDGIKTFDATLSGAITGGTLTVNQSAANQTGYTGSLLFTGQNSLTGLTLNGGVVSTTNGTVVGRLFDPNYGGSLTINGGTVTLGGPERLTTVNVAATGGLVAAGAVTSGAITNAGALVFGSTLNATSITNSGLLTLMDGAQVYGDISNQSGGTIIQSGNVNSVAGNVYNRGVLDLDGDLSAPGAVQNFGTINVIGTVSGSPAVETPGTQTITASQFGGAPGAIVNLGGTTGQVANTLVINQSGASGYQGIFTGPGALTFTGGGDLTLLGANTFTGPLTINAGTIDTTGGGTLSSSTDVTVGNPNTPTVAAEFILGTADTIDSLTNYQTTLVNAALTTNSITNSGTVTASAPVTVTGAVSNAATGTMTLGSDATSAFGSLSNNGAFTASAPLTVIGAVTNTSTGVMTLNQGAPSDFGSLTNSGAITANDVVTVAGPYVQNAGSLTSTVGLFTGSFSGAGGAVHLTNNSPFEIDQSSNGTYAGTIDGSGGVLEEGSAILTLTGVDTYTGSTQVNAGATLALSGSGAIAQSSDVTTNGIFDISATPSGAFIQTLDGGGLVNLGAQTLTLTAASTIFNGVVQGSGGLTVSGGAEGLTGTNTYTGVTTINSGAGLALIGAGSIATSSNVIDNGMFDISTTTSGASIVTLSGSGQVNLGSQPLTLTNASTTFSGDIGGSGAVFLNAGTETLTGENDFTGATTIASGSELNLSGTGSIAASSNVIDNGTFDISATTSGAAIVTLSGAGKVNLGAEPLYLTNASTTFSGVIGGSGGLALNSGTETFTGVDTYTGVTAISAGADLALSGAGSIAKSSEVIDNGMFDISASTANQSITTLAGLGVVNLGARSLTLTQAANTFSGAVQGSGGLTVASGAETLSGTNLYTGATNINAGTSLFLSGLGSIAASSNVIDNGTLNIGGTTFGASIVTLSGAGSVVLGSERLKITNGSTSFSGVISGAGGLTVSGGVETLSGVNTFTGLTTVNTGAKLVLVGAGSVADSGDPLVNGTFDISGTNGGTSVVSLSGSGSVILGAQTLSLSGASDTFSGVIGGSGGLTVTGGVETLSGVNTYTGASQVNPGAALILIGNGSVAASSGVNDNGLFDISGTTSGATVNALTGSGAVNLGAETLTIVDATSQFNGQILGTGSVAEKSGTFVLNGNSSFGATNISGGDFQVGLPNDSVTLTTTGVNVTSGGMLSGFGAVNGPVTNPTGVVQPGSSGTVGTLTVASYTQGSNGTLAIQVTPTAASELKVTGAATLGGTLALNYASGPYTPRIFTIVSGAPVSGGFSNVTKTGLPANVVMGLSQTATAENLTVEPTSAAQAYGAVTTSTLDQAQSLASMIIDRTVSAGCSGDLWARAAAGQRKTCDSVGVWASVLGRAEHTSGSASAPAANQSDGGFMAGVDRDFGGRGSVGLSLGGTQGGMSQSSVSTTSVSNNLFASVYGGVSAGDFMLTGEAYYMNSRWTVKRSVAGYGIARSSPNGETGGAVFQVSHPIQSTGFNAYARFSYADFSRGSAVETGPSIGTLALATQGQSTSSSILEAGVMLAQHAYALGNGVVINPSLRMGVEDDLAGAKRDVSSSLALIGQTGFMGPSVRPDETSGVLAGAVRAKMSDRFDLSADVRARFSGNQTEGAISFSASYRF